MSEFNLEQFLKTQDDGINERFYSTFSVPIGQLYQTVSTQNNTMQRTGYEVIKHTASRD